MNETSTVTRAPFAVRIRQWLETALDAGQTELDAAAKHLQVSPRTLRRRLHAEGETFQGLLDTVRRERALDHLGHGALPISEVSRVLGFTRITSFYRAFRRWTGTTPAAYRVQQRVGEHTGPTDQASESPVTQPEEPAMVASAAAHRLHPEVTAQA